jgi:polar amino acid transport system substrate-binding protein
MAVSDERLQIAISTQPLYTYGARVLVEKGNPLKIHSWDDIAASHQAVGMVTGGAYQPDVEKLGIKVTNYDSLDAEIADLDAGRIKIVANAETSLTQYMKDNPSAPFEVADPWDYQNIGLSQPAWFFNKNQAALRNSINGCVTDLKKDGTMKAILTKFGFNPDGIVPKYDPLP